MTALDLDALEKEASEYPDDAMTNDVILALIQRLRAAEVQLNQFELRAEEADCAQLFLDKKNVPTHGEGGKQYSLVGRIGQYLAAAEKDAERLEFMLEEACEMRRNAFNNKFYLVWNHENGCDAQVDEFATPRESIDAAIAQQRGEG